MKQVNKSLSTHSVIPNDILRDKSLGWDDVGFLIFLLSSCSDNVELSPHERKVIMPRLIKTGYVIETECGSFDVFDTPQF